MTNDDVREAFNICVSGGENPDCDTCPYKDIYDYRECFIVLRRHALELINRQKAEIKNLTSGKCVYLSDDETTEHCVEAPCPQYKTEAQIKAEAYKEVEENIDKITWYHINKNGELVMGANSKTDTPLYKAKDIHNLVKEMVGDNDEYF